MPSKAARWQGTIEALVKEIQEEADPQRYIHVGFRELHAAAQRLREAGFWIDASEREAARSVAEEGKRRASD